MDESHVLQLVEAREIAISGRARSIRERARLSRSEVAGPVGVSDATIEAWEAGRRRPTGEAAIRYLSFLRSLSSVIGPEK